MVTVKVRTPSRASEELCGLKETVRGILSADFEKYPGFPVSMNKKMLSDAELDTPLSELGISDGNRVVLQMIYKVSNKTNLS